jgi:hypothetical protein
MLPRCYSRQNEPLDMEVVSEEASSAMHHVRFDCYMACRTRPCSPMGNLGNRMIGLELTELGSRCCYIEAHL